MRCEPTRTPAALRHRPLDRLRWAAVDSWTMTARNMAHVVRDPGEIIIGFGLPIMFTLVFG